MSTPYITFSGDSGNYISTDDVNLLDADTAHLEQSLTWGNVALGTFTRDSSWSLFGTYSLKIVSTGAGTVYGAAVADAPVVAASTYSYGFWMKLASGGTARTAQARVRWKDSGSSTISYDNGSEVTLSETPVFVSFSGTAPTGAVTVDPYVRVNGVAGSGETFYADKFCIAAGTDASFVPSLRIVGDLDLRAIVAADDWTPTANMLILDNLSGFTGYRLLIDTSGNVEADYGDGTTARAETSALFSLTDGEAAELRVTYDVSSGAVVWYQDKAQVDTDTATVAAGSPSSVGVYIGATDSDTDHFDGDVYWVEIRDGIAGPVVARMDAGDASKATL